jgi:hypothetical protein
MKELSKIYKELGEDFINDLFKDYLTVIEKLSGSTFSFEKIGTSIKFFKSNDKQINLVDRTLMVYYENPINYIKNSTDSFIESIPLNWRFCFQYFVHNEPGVIRYDKLPKNNLVLTHIVVKNKNGKDIKIIEDSRVIKDWSNALGVTPLLPIFKGYLTEDQKNSIKKFIDTPIEDQLEIFKTSSFAEYLIKVLNPTLNSTILQDDLTKPIDSIIFKFYKPGSSNVISAKLIDPYTANLLKHKEPVDPKKVPADINEILILDILAFIEERGLRGGELLSTTPEERYLELLSAIFNEYVTRRGSSLNNLGIEKASFAKGDEFKLNTDLITSQTTKKILKDDLPMQDLFKIMIGSLRKKRSIEKTGNILTPSVIEDFNKLVLKIEDAINKPVDDKFKTFGDYLDLKKTNESYQNADDLIIEEKTLNYNSFINLGKLIINESKKSDMWIDAYNSFSKIKDFVKPSHTRELLRANFGPNDDTAEIEIQKFLLTLGIEQKNYTIERIPVGTFVPSMRGNISGDYDSYEITFTSPTKDTIGGNYKKGEVFYITNRYKISKKTGIAGVFGKKKLAPDAMGLPLAEYKTAASLYSVVESFVKGTAYPDNYKNFILGSTQSIMTNTRNSGMFNDFEGYSGSGKTDVSYDIPSSLFDGIDQISINNFANDYGEVLGGFMLFNILKDVGGGLRYPTSSNERLVDFYFDDYSISSKAGKKGGTPTGDTLIQRMYAMYNEGTLSFDDIAETDFLNNVIKPWVNPPKLAASGIYNTVMNLCSINITDKSNSGYWYLVSQVNVQPAQLTEADVLKHFDELYKDEKSFREVLTTLWNKSGMEWDNKKLDEYTIKYPNAKKRIGAMFYPLIVEITNNLNSKYKSQLTTYSQKVTDVKQIYLNVDVKRGTFKFNTVPFVSANFAFEQKGSIPNPFNANIGIKIEK